MKYNTGDFVLVYKDTPTFKEGCLAQVIDRDPNDNSYAVADLRAVGLERGDIPSILNNHVKWVKEEHLTSINFNKPKGFFAWIKNLRAK